MNKTNLWIVLIVTAIWIGFMAGYAVSSHSGCTKSSADGAPATESTGAGGYGK
jgi:uncharacterized protein YneF (UPF0154 family)